MRNVNVNSIWRQELLTLEARLDDAWHHFLVEASGASPVIEASEASPLINAINGKMSICSIEASGASPLINAINGKISVLCMYICII